MKPETAAKGNSFAGFTDVDPNRCGELMNPLKGTLVLRGGEEVGTGNSSSLNST